MVCERLPRVSWCLVWISSLLIGLLAAMPATAGAYHVESHIDITKRILNAGENRLYCFMISEVSLPVFSFAAGFHNLVHRFLCGVAVDIDASNCCPFRRKQNC